MNIQRVNSQVIGMHIQFSEKFLQSQILFFSAVDHSVGIHVIRFLNKAQQMLLIHAGGCMDVSIHLCTHSEEEKPAISHLSSTVSGHSACIFRQGGRKKPKVV